MTGVLVVLAKSPEAGRVKTRLVPPLTPAQAAALYEHMLRDVLRASARFALEHALEPVAAVHPRRGCAAFARAAPRPFRVVAQRGADLSQRMAWAAREAAAAGAAPIVLRGSDSPALDGATLAQALSALDEADLAICPDRDGGYNLIALRAPVPGLFDHPMSTRSALEDTLANAAARGAHARVLAPGFDIDTIDDLRWLAPARDATHNATYNTVSKPAYTELCSETLAYLDREDLWRFLDRQ